jgi:hypothetical protein
VAEEAEEVVVTADEENFQGARIDTEQEADFQASAAFEDVFAQAA